MYRHWNQTWHKAYLLLTRCREGYCHCQGGNGTLVEYFEPSMSEGLHLRNQWGKRPFNFFERTYMYHHSMVMAALLHVFSKTTAVLTKGAEPVYCITDLAQIGRVPLQCPLQVPTPSPPKRLWHTPKCAFYQNALWWLLFRANDMIKSRQVMGQGPGFADMLGEMAFNKVVIAWTPRHYRLECGPVVWRAVTADIFVHTHPSFN